MKEDISEIKTEMVIHGQQYCYSQLSHARLFVTLWTIAHQAPLSMGFSRQEYLRGLPCSIPGDLPDPGIKPTSLALQMDSLPLVLPGKPNVHDNPYQF